ncbi:MAG: PKD domain-containing protein [Bacteroidota bacterium]
MKKACLLLCLSAGMITALCGNKLTPTAGFTIGGSSCVDGTVTFTNTSVASADPIVVNIWEFGDGGSSTASNPSHTYKVASTYTVTLTVQDQSGDINQFTQTLTIHPVPQVSFGLSTTTADQCVSTTQSFINASSIASNDLDYRWDFGDGSSVSTTADPSHDYTRTGTFTVTLTATSRATGCEASSSQQLTIHPDPVAAFSFENQCDGTPAVFTNNSSVSSGNLSASWTFGDGGISALENPSHLYTSDNSYNVRLTTTTEKGCTDTETQSITIFEQPQAAFTAPDVCLGTGVTFTNSSSKATAYAWDFDDGNVSSAANPTHTYEFPGIYEVSLVASNGDGCRDEVRQFIEVSPVPVAAFSASDVCLGTSMNFQNTSTITSGTLSYDWDFGDGSGGSTAAAPSHLYSAAGTYTVELTVRSLNRCVNVTTRSVEVFEPSVGGTVQGATTLCEDDAASYQLTLTGHTGDIVRWESSTTGVDQWTTIETNAATLDYSSLPVTTFFRAIVKNGSCDEALSTLARVGIDELPQGGVLLGATSVCEGANSGRLDLNGGSGTIREWISSTVGSDGPWVSVSRTESFLTYTNLTTTTHYRVVRSNGVCPNDTSTAVTIRVEPETNAGVLSSNATVCSGNNSGTMTLRGFTGDIIRWEAAFNANGPWSSIDVQANTLDYTNLTATTYYRVQVQNGGCAAAVSNQVVITVDPPTLTGTLTGTSSVCQRDGTGDLTLQNFRGDILKWQESANGVSWSDIVNTTASLSLTSLTDTTFYRVEVQSGVCAAAFTPAFRVAVNADPQAGFTNDEVCVGNATTFTNTTTIQGGQGLSYTWDFSDGSGSSLENPTHFFATAGNYRVKLTATSSTGCVDSVTRFVVVNENPVVAFSQNNVCLGQTMQFINLSTPGAASVQQYDWDFGDGNTSTDQNPSHLYAAEGTYDVTLEMTTLAGCTRSLTQEVSVGELPEVAFAFDNVCDGQDVRFTNQTTLTAGNLSYTWNFGDGDTSTDLNPVHRYDQEGTFQVNLQAQTENGCTTNLTQSLTVYNQPVATFTASDECLDSLVRFTNATTGTALTFDWDFGDGTTSTDENPVHQYDAPSLYTASLTVTGNEGCSNRFTSRVRIHPLPVVNFATQDVCDTVTAPFSNFSSIASGSMTYEWDFGDGATSNETEPAHRYAIAATYPVRLTATSDAGCVTYLDKSITVSPRPQADFTFMEVCDGLPTSFQNASTISSGTIGSFLWEFGDQTSALVENPNKQYLNDGKYDVSLEVTSGFGCTDKVSKEVQVFEEPIADFDVANTCIGFNINPQNTSSIGPGSLLYAWDFGDGTSSELANPSHEYAAPGIYTLTLTATTPNGCRDVIQKDVRIYDLPVITVSKDTTVSQGFPIMLTASGGADYVWSPVDGLDNSNVANPIATPQTTTTYAVLATDAFGCQNTGNVTVTVDEDFRLVATNVFTPDGNGRNDFWVIENVETFGSVNVRVYDRFGQLVFQDEAYQNDWAGTAGNDILPDGTYYYLITFSDSPTQYSGAITLIRNR